ncbi:MAG: Arm DNA-binding domain-containing protein [Methylocystis sp.]
MGKLIVCKVEAAKAGKHGDSDGLQLVVTSTGARKWVLRFMLGGYPEVGLAEARAAAFEARKLVAGGIDPIEARDAARKVDAQARRAIPTFAEIAALVIAGAQARSTNEKVKYQWARHLGPAYCAPLLARPVNEISTQDVAAVLRPVWESKPEVARKLHPAIRRVFERARVILKAEHGVAMLENPPNWSDMKAQGFHAFHCSGEKPDAEETQKTVSQPRVQSPVTGLRRRIARSRRGTVLMSVSQGVRENHALASKTFSSRVSKRLRAFVSLFAQPRGLRPADPSASFRRAPGWLSFACVSR